jgi:hypothetical protein
MEPQNPFELMMNPAAVLEAIERSTHLAGLASRVYRPLDRQGAGKRRAGELEDFDREVDLTNDNADD